MTKTTENLSDRDSLISFDEANHTYTYEGQNFISVTTLIDNYFSHFEVEKIAAKKAAKMGVSPEILIEEWRQKGDESRQLGTTLHSRPIKSIIFL